MREGEAVNVRLYLSRALLLQLVVGGPRCIIAILYLLN